jgi:hypothetical protein
MLMAPDVLDVNPPLMDAMRRAFDQAAQVLQPANAWERDRLATKIVELVKAGELDEQRLCRGALSGLAAEFAPEGAA